MSLHEYVISKKISADDPPFYALIMAAMRQADSLNMDMLTEAFPAVRTELGSRYNAPGGCLTDNEKDWLERWENRKREESDGNGSS